MSADPVFICKNFTQLLCFSVFFSCFSQLVSQHEAVFLLLTQVITLCKGSVWHCEKHNGWLIRTRCGTCWRCWDRFEDLQLLCFVVQMRWHFVRGFDVECLCAAGLLWRMVFQHYVSYRERFYFVLFPPRKDKKSYNWLIVLHLN